MTFKIGINPLVAVILMAVLDPDFRAALKEDAGKAIEGSGLKLDAGDMMTLDGLNLGEWDELTLKDLNDRLILSKALNDRGIDIDTGGDIDSGSAITSDPLRAKKPQA